MLGPPCGFAIVVRIAVPQRRSRRPPAVAVSDPSLKSTPTRRKLTITRVPLGTGSFGQASCAADIFGLGLPDRLVETSAAMSQRPPGQAGCLECRLAQPTKSEHLNQSRVRRKTAPGEHLNCGYGKVDSVGSRRGGRVADTRPMTAILRMRLLKVSAM